MQRGANPRRRREAGRGGEGGCELTLVLGHDRPGDIRIPGGAVNLSWRPLLLLPVPKINPWTILKVRDLSFHAQVAAPPPAPGGAGVTVMGPGDTVRGPASWREALGVLHRDRRGDLTHPHPAPPPLRWPAPSFGPASLPGDPCPTSSHRTRPPQFLLLPMVLPSDLRVPALSTVPGSGPPHCDPRALLHPSCSGA